MAINWQTEVEQAAADGESLERLERLLNDLPREVRGHDWLLSLPDKDVALVLYWVDKLIEWAVFVDHPLIERVQGR